MWEVDRGINDKIQSQHQLKKQYLSSYELHPSKNKPISDSFGGFYFDEFRY